MSISGIKAQTQQIDKDPHNPKPKTTTSSNIVGDMMWPLILFLKMCGHSPVAYEETETTSKVKMEDNPVVEYSVKAAVISKTTTTRHYKLDFKPISFVWSLLCALWILWAWTEHVTRGSVVGYFKPGLNSSVVVGQGKYPDVSSSSIIPIIRTVSRITLAVIQGVELLLVWAESASLVRFLNAWTSIQQDFQKLFPFNSLQRYGDSLKKSRNLLILVHVALPSTLLVPFFMSHHSLNDFNRFVISITCAWHLSLMTLMEDVKVILSYHALAQTFAQIRDGILQSLKEVNPTVERVMGWRRLVQSVTLQVENAGESQKSHQLLLIGGAVVSLTIHLFLLLHGPLDPSHSSFYYKAAAFVCLQMGRLYLKIKAANDIVQEKRRIANELVLIEPKANEDPRIQFEIVFLRDMIIQNPSAISFGSYVILNKRLILGISSQVVAYLIILIQIKNYS